MCYSIAQKDIVMRMVFTERETKSCLSTVFNFKLGHTVRVLHGSSRVENGPVLG